MPLPISLTPPTDPTIRRALRVLAMVHELHKAGYQKLRIAPGASLSGCYWRCHITHAGNVQRNGWEPRDWQRMVATYTTGQDDHYFDWNDATGKNARQLARMFVERFPEIAREGQGTDRPYAGWYVEMLGAAEHGQLPEFFADYPLDLDPDRLPPSPPEVSEEAPRESLTLIANDALRADMLPAPDARWEEIEPFCLTFDGYEAASRMGIDAHGVASRVARDGVCAASMDDLRIALFITQRRVRWNSPEPVSGDDLRFVRGIIEEIRSRIAPEGIESGPPLHAMRTVIHAGIHLIESEGFGRLRILPYRHANGWWRCEFHPEGWRSRTLFRYSASSRENYLASHCGGRIPRDATPEQLAAAIMISVSDELQEACRGPVEPEMRLWLQALKSELDRDHIPEAFHEFTADMSRWAVFHVSGTEVRSMPPMSPPPGYMPPGEEESPWAIDFEAPKGDAWIELANRDVICLRPERTEDMELIWDTASAYLQAIGTEVSFDRCRLFARAIQFALTDLCDWSIEVPITTSPGCETSKPMEEPEALSPNGALGSSGLVVEKRPLDSFDLSTEEGRFGLFWNLYDHYQEAGTLLAVNHIWASLGRPKAKRCEAMAQKLGLPGEGKQALVNVIKRFLQEALYEVEIPDLPDRSAFEDSDAWSSACLQHFNHLRTLIGEVVERYEAVLDGRDPLGRTEGLAGSLIQGPWSSPEATPRDR